MSTFVEFRPKVQVVVGIVKEWIDEHRILVTSDDGESEYDFDLGGFEIEVDSETQEHVEEEEDDLHVGDTVMVVTTRHLVVTKRK